MGELRRVARISVVAVILLVMGWATAMGAVIHVDADASAGGDGAGWGSAYKYLQDALAGAVSSDEIWVAVGTYRPDEDAVNPIGTDDRTATFQLISGVMLYGGFAGGETSLDERDWQNNRTILSGDLSGDDGPGFVNNDENSFHVVTGSGTNFLAVVDGFTIAGGNADGTPPSNVGGGMYNNSGSPKILNCVFQGNSAGLGGGVLNENASPQIFNSIFVENHADFYGGGMGNTGSSVKVTNCVFTRNHAEQNGGAMAYFDSSPVISNCILRGDTAGVSDAEIHKDLNSPLNVRYNNIEGGYSGVSSIGNIDEDPQFADPLNGDFHLEYSSPCINMGYDAAVISVSEDFDGDARILNGRVDIGVDEVVGFSITVESDLKIGGSVEVDPGWKIYPAGMEVTVTAVPIESYVFQSWSGDLEGATNPGTVIMDGDRTITAHFWYTSEMIIYVNDTAGGGNNGSSWNDAYTNLQDAFDEADIGNVIWVKEGTYQPTHSFSGSDPRWVAFSLKNGVAVYGGFAEIGDAVWEERDPNAFETVLDGDIGLAGFNFDNCYHVFYHYDGLYLDDTAILDGFVISGGNSGANPINTGGGMYNKNCSPKISKCVFTDNNASYRGGGMYNELSDPLIVDCKFIDNTSIGSSSSQDGGGMCNNLSSPTIRNCFFSGNTADSRGGGMENVQSSPLIEGCTFTGNTAGTGGGIDNQYSNPDIINCVFSNNNAVDGHGGGIANNNSVPTITDCDFLGNSAGVHGGGLYNGISSATVTGCFFSGNSAWTGGGMSSASCAPQVTKCVFANNHASGTSATGGGGMTNWMVPAFAKVTACTFRDNTAVEWGAGMYNYLSSPEVTNCIFYGNVADDQGGGMQNYDQSEPRITNCTFYGNSASSGGGICSRYNSAVSIYNCILWMDTGGEIHNTGGTSTLSYCDVQGGYGDPVYNNIDVDPSFVDPANGDFHLQSDSLCIDAGNNVLIQTMDITEDFEGDPRIFNDTVDIGADEFTIKHTMSIQTSPAGGGSVALVPPGGIYVSGTEVNLTATATEGYAFDHWSGGLGGSVNPETVIMDSNKTVTAHFAFTGSVIYVNGTAAGVNNGTSWVDAFTDLQDALDVADSGHEIWVAAGTYTPSVERGGIGDRYKSYQMKNDVAVYGGLAGNENHAAYDLDNRDYVTNETILSGDIGIEGNDGDNSYHVFYHGSGSNVDATAILNGFTITGGNANNFGGGVFNSGGSYTMVNCRLIGNSASVYGGAVYNENNASPIYVNCEFIGNSAVQQGGGMYNFNLSSPTVTNCIFSGNMCPNGYGGGAYNYVNSSPTFTNCTFSGNLARFTGGMRNYGNSNPTVRNCVLWGNIGVYGPGERAQIETLAGFAMIDYCCVEGWTGTLGGAYNFGANPLFVDADGQDNMFGTEDDDLRLSVGSPCIDAGDNGYVPIGVTTDVAGYPRVIDGVCNGTGVVDIGAYEFNYAYMGDFDYNCVVNSADFGVFASAWLSEPGDAAWDPICNIGIPANARIDDGDLVVFAQHWLENYNP